MREVETKLFGLHGRAGLAHMVAEHLLQHLVEEMRRRVVRHRRIADVPRHDSSDAVALREAQALKHELLVVYKPERLDELRPRAVFLLDPAGVGDLAAARRIERRLGELDLEKAFAEVGERGDRGPHVELLVADELGSGRAGEARLVAGRAALAGGLAMPRHQPRVLLVVETEAALAPELLGELDGKAVRRLQIEDVLCRELALCRHFLEDRHPALERLAEALLLGREHAVDLVPVLDELGIRLSHLLDHDVGQARQERRLHPDPQAVLRRAPDDAPQDVAATLVRRRDALGDDERHPPAVVGEHAMRLRRVGRRAVRRARLLLDPVHDQPVAVGVVDGSRVLHDARDALEPPAGVDVLGGQLG